MSRTKAKAEFLSGLVVTAIENSGYGWFTTHEYEQDEIGLYYAVIQEDVDDDATGAEFRVDVDTMAKGIGVIRNARPAPIDGDPANDWVLHNATTGQRLYMSKGNRDRILNAYRDNDAGDLDVIDALAILECAVFGAVTHA